MKNVSKATVDLIMDTFNDDDFLDDIAKETIKDFGFNEKDYLTLCYVDQMLLEEYVIDYTQDDIQNVAFYYFDVNYPKEYLETYKNVCIEKYFRTADKFFD